MSAGRMVAAGVLALALAGCGREVSPPSSAPSSAPVVVRADPAHEGCVTLQGLGTSGSVAQYRVVAEVLRGADDAGVAAAAGAVYDLAASSVAVVNRPALLGAVLDLAEACLRVTG